MQTSSEPTGFQSVTLLLTSVTDRKPVGSNDEVQITNLFLGKMNAAMLTALSLNLTYIILPSIVFCEF